MSAIELIRAERQRQISEEGWTAEHDDAHDDGALLRAAVIYLHCDPARPMATPMNGDMPMAWPWAAQWWKPKDRKSNLIRSGALCLAEAERRARAGLSSQPADHKLALAVERLDAVLDGRPEPSLPIPPATWDYSR